MSAVEDTSKDPSDPGQVLTPACAAIAAEYATARDARDVCGPGPLACGPVPGLGNRLGAPGCCMPMTAAREAVVGPSASHYIAAGWPFIECTLCPLPLSRPCEADGTSSCN
jgi:hypothetical protein